MYANRTKRLTPNREYYARKSSNSKKSPRSTPSIHWKEIKLLAYAICTLVCIYQIYVYLNVYFNYPTSVDAQVYINEIPAIPATTYCPSPVLIYLIMCKTDPKYCNESSVTEEEAISYMSKQWNETKFITPGFYNYANNTQIILNETNCPGFWMYNGLQMCVVKNSVWKPMLEIKEDFAELVFDIDVEMTSKVNFDAIYGVDVFLHGRSRIPTRSLRTYFITIGNGYKINFQKTVVERLKAPYQTKCFEYQKHENFKPESFSLAGQDTCFFSCLWKKMKLACGCIPKSVTSLVGSPNCSQNGQDICLGNIQNFRNICASQCPVGCTTDYYDFTIVQTFSHIKKDKYHKSSVYLELRGCIEVLFIHKPQIQIVEVFSYIGGFMGIWLGVCVPQMIEMTVTLLIIRAKTHSRIRTEMSASRKRNS